MSLDHEKLDVYSASLDFVTFAHALIESFPGGRSHIADQLRRASISVVLNIAEGAGKYSPADKRRYYLSACGSAKECSAIMDILLRLALADEKTADDGKKLLERIVMMLTGLAKRMEENGSKSSTRH